MLMRVELSIHSGQEGQCTHRTSSHLADISAPRMQHINDLSK
jgi:hypothetical protein